MAESKFDRQLKQLLNGDVENDIDSLPDGEEEEQQVEELVPVVYDDKPSQMSIDNNPDLQHDYEFARSNYYGLIGRTNAAVDLALRVAQMSEHPRAMEVAANLMKTSADITKDLLSLQKSIQNDTKSTKTPSGTYVQNNYYGDKSPDDIDQELDGLDDTKK
jgi:hypothetical protein